MSARDEVTAGLGYEANIGSIMQYTLDAETGQRGYLLTGEPSYLDPARVAVKRAPAVLQTIRNGSRGDPVLRRDYAKLVTLLEARLRDLVATVNLYKRGAVAQALRLVKTNRGNRDHSRGPVAACREMSTRSQALVARARGSARERPGVGEPRRDRRVPGLGAAARGDVDAVPDLPGHRGRAPRVAAGAARGRAPEPRQVRLSLAREPRVAHAAQRDPRVRPAARARPDRGGRARDARPDALGRPPPARDRRRPPRPLADRERGPTALARAGSADRRARRGEVAHLPPAATRRRSGSGSGRSTSTSTCAPTVSA